MNDQWKEFLVFLKEYNIISLAVGFVMGAAANDLAKSLINNLLMPFISPLTAKGWREATLSLGPIDIKWGAVLAETLHFLLLALVIFIIVKKLIVRKAEEEAAKKKAA